MSTYGYGALPDCWIEVEDALTAGIDRLILFGPPGTGKTYAGLHLGNVAAGSHRLICTEDMTSANIEGMWRPNGSGAWSWTDGAAIKAWDGDGLSGGRLVVDEIDKASGDVLGLLLAMLDSPESASWEHPETGRTVRPRDGFSAVMTTNVRDVAELPEALIDRFPIAIRINQPHPSALERLPYDLRAYAARMADAGTRRISLRKFEAFRKLRAVHGDERAAKLCFRDQAEAVLDAIRIDGVA